MTGHQEAGSTPPEVPEEFAAAYRAAYERAMAAQSRETHRRLDDDRQGGASEAEESALPPRRGRLLVGSHRGEAPTREPPPRPSVPRAAGDTGSRAWLVPVVLLVVLALLLVLGAYVVGRVFSESVQDTQVTSTARFVGR